MPAIAFIDDDLKLAESIKERDLQSLARLYDIYAAALFGIICRIVPDENLAEEILSTVFIKVWNQVGDFSACGTSLFTWLLTITRETAIEKMRREGQTNPAYNNTVHTENKKMANEISACNASSHLEAFDLIYNKGLSLAEAAATLGKSIAELRIGIRDTIKNLQDKKAVS